MNLLAYHPQFFTATILDWKPLLKPDKYKQVIIESLQCLINEKRVKLFGFVIMKNHIHLIWQMNEGIKRENLQRDFLKFTAQRIKLDLELNHPLVLTKFKVDLKDRIYQFWKRNPLSVDIFSEEVMEQKLDYIHQNPVKAGICNLEEEYKYSSAKFYREGIDEFNILTHYKD